MAKRELLKIIKSYLRVLISEGYDIKEAYLFGSYAKKTENKDSDIDIAVVLGSIEDYFDTLVELMKLRHKVNINIEPHPISANDFLSHPLFNEIKKFGIKISF
jgi:predicted nucleotidyltransferase